MTGGIALASDTIGFITILLIEVRIIQEMAITASLGVAVIILTNLFLLPVLLSYVRFSDSYNQKLAKRARRLEHFWDFLARVSEPRNAGIVIIIALCLKSFFSSSTRKASAIFIRPGGQGFASAMRYFPRDFKNRSIISLCSLL